MRLHGIDRFDGVLAFGESLRALYSEGFGLSNVWTLHEAADTSVFRPLARSEKSIDVAWVGNWGDDERSAEISEFLVRPAHDLAALKFTIHGVRYPDDALSLLQDSGIRYGGYLPNLRSPALYAAARVTVHIPRQQYVTSMIGIPTIRVFEALACGIPLISAPWKDTEGLFREGEFLMVRSGAEMKRAICRLVRDKKAAEEQALRGLETILSRHTCRHRAEQLTQICEEVVQ
jgi:spore maturation protein CgeB